ncbi:MAG: hypothetical protein KDC92_08975, partial [Bacteroidetes bacterium]|nr:hypothetical protein [Bacteroidota bacterium]
MKKFILPAVTLLAVFGMIQLSSCGKVDCNETPDHEDCPKDTTPKDTTPKFESGNLVIVVQNYDKDRPVNNDKALAVLGKSKEDMIFFKYAMKGNPQRPTLENAATLKDEKRADTFYSWKD